MRWDTYLVVYWAFGHFQPKRYLKGLSVILALLVIATSVKFVFLKPARVFADALLLFDEGQGTTINDNNGNISGTIVNAVWKPADLCVQDTCLYFDGTGDLVNFSDDSDLDFAAASNFTLEGWFRTPDITSGQRTIIAKYDGTTGTDGGYKVYMDSSGYVVFGIDDDQTSFPEDSASTSTTAFDDNQWHHFAAVKTGTTSMTLYIDGRQYQTDSSIAATGTLANTDIFYVGIDGDASSNGFSGFLDQIKVYGSVRTTAEIQADFLRETPARGTSASFGPDYSWISNGLVGYWSLDETASPAVDYSGNEKNGTWTGTPAAGTGKFGNAINLNGSTQYVSMGDQSNHDIALPLSISVWINIDALPSVAGHDYEIISKYGAAPNRQWTFAIGTDDILYFWKSHDGTNGEYVDSLGYTFTSSDVGVWKHFTITIDSRGIAMLFVNGANTDSGSVTNVTLYSGASTNLLIGARNNPANYFDGRIDEVRIYNRALSPSEAQSLYNWAPGPVAWWKMDEVSGTRFDQSTNGNSLTESDTVTASIGKFGQSAYFNNLSVDNGQGLNITDASQNGLDITGPITVEAWVKVETASTFQGIAGKDGNAGGRGYGLQWGSADNIRFLVSNDGTATTIITGSTTLSVNTWYHLAAVYNGSNLYVYVNGISDATPVSYSSGIFDSTGAKFAIGGRGNLGLADGFDGFIDDVRVYNYARSSGQIIEDMNAGHPAPGSPVGSATGFWSFDEGYSTTAYDKSSNANHLTTAVFTNNGKFGKAFDGADNRRLTGTNDADFEPGDGEGFSISTWVKSDGTSAAASEYVVSKVAASSAGYDIYFNTSEQIVCEIDDDGTSYPEDSATTTGNYYDQAWHHVVCVRDISADKLNLYVDGKLVAQDTDLSATGAIDNSAIFYLGDTNGTDGTDEFLGDIDETKFYRLALTKDQVNVEYTQGSMAVMGALSSDSTGRASWSNADSYCPPGQGSACVAPVAEWKMDENTGTTLQDSSTNGNTSTTWYGTNIWVSARYGSGLNFNNADGSVRFAETTSTDLGATGDSYTVSAWFKTADPSGGPDDIVVKFAANSGAHPFRLYIGSTLFSFSCNDGTTGCGSGGIGNSLNDNKWHFVAGVRDVAADKTYAYIDGVLVDSDADNTTASLANNDDISIGNGRASYTTDDFNGVIDQVRIYNYARSQSQIAWEFNRGKPIGWWKLDECQGATAYDSSDNSNNGTITPGATGTHTSVGSCDSGSASEMWDDGGTGKRNYSLDFDGTNDYVDMNDVALLDFTDGQDFSISGWFNRETYTTDNIIVSKTTALDNTGLGYAVYIDDSTDKLTLHTCDATSGCDEYTLASTTAFTSTGWNHFVVTWDDDSAANTEIYINGNADNATDTGTIGNVGSLVNVRDFRIGSLHAGGSPFAGELDDIQVFSFAVNAAQARMLYNEASAVRYGPSTGAP